MRFLYWWGENLFAGFVLMLCVCGLLIILVISLESIIGYSCIR
jgi:hypothetical protein